MSEETVILEAVMWIAMSFGIVGVLSFPFNHPLGGALCTIGWAIHLCGFLRIEDDGE